MKDNGKHAKQGAAMVKGEQPFDLAAAKAIFASFEESAAKMPQLFPKGSTTGHETTAAPKIWTQMDDFKSRFAKFGEDAKKAQASVTDLASFKAAFGPMSKSCGGCHKEYRIKRD
jgi:cytochrome c556